MTAPKLAPAAALAARTCVCGRVFAKPFGARVHGRTCPIERARSEAFVAAAQAGKKGADFDATLDDAVAAAKAAERGWGVPTKCQWFALCEHTATRTRQHPILGPVPLCARCDAQVTAADGPR